MINSIKKYMFVDLLLLASIGFILELLVVKFSGLVLYAAPSVTIALLIAFIAVARWDLWGLLICPILALATLIGGQKIELSYIAAVYDYKMYISILFGYCGLALNVIFFRKFSTNKVITGATFIGLMIFDYVVFCSLQTLSYYLLCVISHDSGQFTYQVVENGELKNITTNIQHFGMGGFIYNSFGFIVLIVGGFVSRSQGIMRNRTQQFVDDKENAELMAKDRYFSIEEAKEDAHVGDDNPQKEKNEEIH